ncbi:MAG TPA: DUF6636 domain-containing protein [Gaiellaceae bacterium]|nr:DUF6636 domain-containing protein [Gaiellaceae bacterium]
MRRVLAICAVALLAGPNAAVAARADKFTTFRTPSGNIGCIYSSGFEAPASLRCDIRSRLVPQPKKPHDCPVNWGDSYDMEVTGKVFITCHGDTAIDPKARALAYGERWSLGGFACLSRAIGLTCRNRSGHGFFMSRQHSYRF